MTPARLARLLDAHGPALRSWPAPRRAAAERLLATSADARALLAAAQALEARLAGGLADPAPDALARLRDAVAWRIARAPLPAPAGTWDKAAALLRPAAPAGWGALAAIATCALWFGLAPAPTTADPLAPLQTLPIAEDPL